MALFFRAIESPDGRWECRQGRLVFDQHANVEEALDHLRSLARDTHEAFELFAHSRDRQIIRHETAVEFDVVRPACPDPAAGRSVACA